MQRHVMLIVWIAFAGAASAEQLRQDTTGFYPMWESTGYVEERGDVRISTSGLQIGTPLGAHVGVQPVSFIERTPNVYVKVSLPAPGGWHFAAQAGGYRLLAGGGGALFSPMYSTRLDNRDFAVTLVPVSFAASRDLAPWLELHQTLTGLAVDAAQLKTKVTPGYSVVVGLNPHGRHGITLHAAEVGFWDHDLAIAGASYRYRNGWMELRLGYFYRFTKSGTQGAPIAGFGVLL